MRREAGISNLEYFSEQINDHEHQVIDAGAPSPTVVFLAVRGPNGVECWLARCEWSKWSRFTYDLHPEASGISTCSCPKRILDQLSPVEQLYSGARAQRAQRFRDRCRERLERLAAAPKVKRGDLVHFDPPVRFRGGDIRDTLEYIGRSRFRAGGFHYILGADWKITFNWSIMENVSDEDRRLLLS